MYIKTYIRVYIFIVTKVFIVSSFDVARRQQSYDIFSLSPYTLL